MQTLAFREVRRRLLRAGFLEISQKGSHVKFGKQTKRGFRTAIVPKHREVSSGTLRSILRQAGLSAEEFDNI